MAWIEAPASRKPPETATPQRPTATAPVVDSTRRALELVQGVEVKSDESRDRPGHRESGGRDGQDAPYAGYNRRGNEDSQLR